MHRLARRLPVLAAVVVVLGLVAGPAGAVPNDVSDRIIGSGSDTTYTLLSELDQLYNQSPGCSTIPPPGGTVNRGGACANRDAPNNQTNANADHDVITQLFPLGSSNGITQLVQRGQAGVTPIDFARSSRGPRPVTGSSTDNANIRFVAFAREALTWVAFSQDLPRTLTQDQLRGIFLDEDNNQSTPCRITNWNQVGGPDRPIIVYSAQAGSGTRGDWDGFIGGDTTGCIPPEFKDNDLSNGNRVVFENNASLIAPADRPGAIYFYSTGNHKQTRGEGTFLGAVNGVQPTNANIASSTFLFSRSVYNVYRATFPSDNTSDQTLDYIAFNPANGAPGFLCRPDTAGAHATNPRTGRSYGDEIRRTITRLGFSQLPVGPTGDGVPGESLCRQTRPA